MPKPWKGTGIILCHARDQADQALTQHNRQAWTSQLYLGSYIRYERGFIASPVQPFPFLKARLQIFSCAMSLWPAMRDKTGFLDVRNG